MTNENRDNCVQSIIYGTTRTADWRDKVFDRYHDDKCIWASKALRKLAGEAPNLNDHYWSKLEPHFESGSERFREAVSETAKNVGFQHKSKSFPFFVNNLVAALTAAN